MHILGTFYIFYVLLCILYAVFACFVHLLLKRHFFSQKKVPAATRIAKGNSYLPTFGDHLGIILESSWSHVGVTLVTNYDHFGDIL